MRKFKAESLLLIDMMITAIYTNKEIFLRELISNASDAVDKLYFKSLTDSSIQLSKDDLRIVIDADQEERRLVISDTGIGMDKDDLEKNLSTIAHSGSLDFKAENADADSPEIDIIGQFGVGFYSAFMVAERVEVLTRRYGDDKAWKWVSTGVEGYTIEEAQKETHGTDVILTMKTDDDQESYSRFCDQDEIKHLVRKYSNYVRYPIQMETTMQRALPKPDDADDDYKTQYEDYVEIETLNSMIPIWKKAKGEVTPEEHNEFYKQTFHDFADPARTITLRAEGTISYDALLFIPSQRPFDLYTRDYKKGPALYSSGVMIMEHCEDLLPDCFGFVRGVVDSPDLSLNISREILQQDRQLRAIERRIEKKIKSELADMRDNDRETYEKIFEAFGRTIKYAIYSSFGQEADLLEDLLLFHSASEQKMVTLDEYASAMPEGQKTVYYAAGDSVDLLSKMPIVKSVMKRGYDVLLCTEDVDEFCLTMLKQRSERDFQNVAGGDLDITTDEEKEQAETVAEENSELFQAMKEALGDSISKVTVSTRLSDDDAPVCLVAEGPLSFEMERVLATMPDGDGAKASRILEINPDSSVFGTLKAAQEAGDSDKVALYSKILYNQALLVEGLPIDDPVAYAQDVSKLMS